LIIVVILGPGVHYLWIHWAWGPIWGRKVVRRGVNVVRGVRVSNWRSQFGLGGQAEDEYILD